jgi:hypothetical protein
MFNSCFVTGYDTAGAIMKYTCYILLTNFLSLAAVDRSRYSDEGQDGNPGWSQRGYIFAEMPVLKEPNKVT